MGTFNVLLFSLLVVFRSNVGSVPSTLPSYEVVGQDYRFRTTRHVSHRGVNEYGMRLFLVPRAGAVGSKVFRVASGGKGRPSVFHRTQGL